MSGETEAEITKQLEKLKTAPKESSRARAAQALGKLGEDAVEATDDLIYAGLNDKSAKVRGRAVLALGRIGSEKALETILKIMQEDPNAQVRSRAAWAVSDYRDYAKKIIPILRKCVTQPINAGRKFYYHYSLAKLEGKEGETIKLLAKQKKEGKLERWQAIHYENLCKEFDIQKKVLEAQDTLQKSKEEAQNVEEEFKVLKKTVDQQVAGDAKDNLVTVANVLQKMIDEQQRTIQRQEETIKSLNESLQELLKTHQYTITEKEEEEPWIKRNLGALLGGIGSLLAGIVAVIGWLAGILGWV